MSWSNLKQVRASITLLILKIHNSQRRIHVNETHKNITYSGTVSNRTSQVTTNLDPQ